MKPEILLVGSDHFNNRFANSDPDEEYLTGLNKLRKILINYQPTRVCVEQEADEQGEINASYSRYKDKPNQFFKNESYDLGFHVALKSGLENVVAMDRMSTDGKDISVSPAMEWAHSSDENHPFLKKLKKLQTTYESIFGTNDPFELFMTLNNKSTYKMDEEIYNSMIPLGDDTETSIPWLAWWYKRNLVMSHHISKESKEGDKVIVIVGQSHLYILKQMLEGSDDYKVLTFYDLVQKEGLTT